jgi:type VI secretion system protein ImpI
MELEFEISKSHPVAPGDMRAKTFSMDGGVIGRADDCDWTVNSPQVSNHHAQVSFRDGEFFLTDLSANGSSTVDGSVPLAKGRPHRIRQGAGYFLADIEIRARLSGQLPLAGHEPGLPQPADSLKPLVENAVLDPLEVLANKPGSSSNELSRLIRVAPAPSTADHAQIEREHLIVPTLICAEEPALKPPAAELPSEDFWSHLGHLLGVDMQGLSGTAREGLAITAAELLQQCVTGLQQSLRTCSELKSELGLPVTLSQISHKNPLQGIEDARGALSAMLQSADAKQRPASTLVSQGFRELQAHQVAMLAASRAALNAALDQCAPQRMRLKFERDRPRRLFNTDGSRWRAYQRHHHALTQNDEWSERLLASDFATTYQEQVRLIATLHTEYQG